MSRARRPVLERSGRPELAPVEDAVQRLFDQQGLDAQDIDAAADGYSATASDWASPAPTTKNEAITRLAAAVAGLLAGPIP